MSRDVRGACALYYQYDIHRHGHRVRHTRPKLSHSFLIAYARMLYLKFAAATNQSITNTAGASQVVYSWTYCDVDTAAGTSTNGLVTGTGTNAVALADTALQTQIAHGVGAGQLDYGASVVNAPSSDSTSTTLILTRVFANSSGGSITVREIGIYAGMIITTATTQRFCIVRDLATIALVNGDQLTLNYILKTIS